MPQFKRLTFDGVNDLYQTPFGARTLSNYEELVSLRSSLKPEMALREENISDELSFRNERCIDVYGCGMF